MVGMVDLCGGILSLYIVKLFKRKTLMVYGNFIIGFCHIVIGFAVINNLINVAFIMIMVFVYHIGSCGVLSPS